MEQDLKLRILHDALNEDYHNKKEDVITLLIALQHQCFVLGNSITNLVHKWPEPPTMENIPSTNSLEKKS